jgi:starch synthase
MLAAEAHPFSKTGGLADVTTALSKALGGLGHDVTLVTPRYRGVDPGTPVATEHIYIAGHAFTVDLSGHAHGPGARVLLADCPPLFDRAGIYNEGGVDYDDNALRYAVLNAAAVEWSRRQPEPFHILHGHDWQAGLLPLYLRRLAEAGRERPCSVFTIHNLAYQGIVNKSWMPRIGLGWDLFTVNGLEFHDGISLLKAGVNFSDLVTTVSPTYAEEIQRPEYGYGFDGIMRARRDRLVGILNGIDVENWNPATDRHLPAPFDAADLSGKRQAKRVLLQTYGLPVTDETTARPVVGMVSRLVDQKGLDLISAIAGELPSLDATFVVLGSGDRRYQDMWNGLAAWRPDRVAVHIGFDEHRAHLIEGGADIFLMPSRYEPCGLNQMYSLRYGTVPIVRAVGGLVDTVRPYDPRNGQGTGFLFSDYSPAALLEALTAALAVYRAHPAAWARLQKNGMRKDFSWAHSAAEYVTVYKRAMGWRRGTRQAAHGI